MTDQRRVALLVGIAEYPSKLLRFCVDDARDLAQVLSMPEYGFETGLLLNADVSLAAVVKAL